jgi:zinc transport system permease protein
VSWLYSWWIDLAHALGLPAAFQYDFVARGVVAILLLAPLFGGLSHLIVARRLAFFSAALGQAALTGLTIGLVAGEPIDGIHVSIYGFCLACAVLMVYVRRRAILPNDTVIGVFMAFTLGLGVCLLVAATRTFNIHQIEAVMFGSLLTVTDADLALLLVLVLVIGALFVVYYNTVLADSLHPALGRGAKAAAILEYLFVVAVTFAIAVSLKVIGAILVEAMVVVPAAAGRNVARSVKGYLGWSIAVAAVAGIAGMFISTAWRVPTGGAIVLALTGCFIVTLVAGAFRGR